MTNKDLKDKELAPPGPRRAFFYFGNKKTFVDYYKEYIDIEKEIYAAEKAKQAAEENYDDDQDGGKLIPAYQQADK